LEKALEIKRRAQKKLQAGDLEGAVAEYERLLEAEETDPYVFVTLGDLLFKKGQRDDAGRRYREAAQSYERTGLVKNAIAVCKKMLRLGLETAETTRYLGDLYAQDGLASEATVHFVQYADFCLANGDRRAAVGALERATDLSPDDPQHWDRLGEVWSLEGESLKGAQALLKGAQARERRGEPEEATRLVERAEAMHPGVRTLTAHEAETVVAGEPLPRGGGPGGPDAPPPGGGASSFPPAAHAAGSAPPSDNGGSQVEGLDSHRTFAPPAAKAVSREAIDVPFGDDRAPASTQAVSGGEVQTGSTGPSTGEVPAAVADYLGRARDLLAQGDREAAAEELLGAAQAWQEAGGLDQAAAIYHELSKSPQATERLYRLWLGNCERRQQWREAAVVCCELGDLALAAQEPATAHEWVVTALSYDPDNERAARRLERLKEWGERSDAAPAADRITVKRRMPEDFDIDLGELVSAFQEGVKQQVEVDDARSRFDLGMTYRQMGLLDEAVAEFRLASRNPEFRLMAMDLLGRALLERGDFGAAIAELERGLATPGLPLDAEVNFRYNLGLALEASGRVVEALTQFESVFEAEPNYPDVALKIRELRR
jgi:tetratricopeptide (TPR) repeat protein